MAKRKNRSKRSVAKLPKGLPTRESVGDVNPFEVTHRQKRPKFHVHNRIYEPSLRNVQHTTKKKTSALSNALKERKRDLQDAAKANFFADQRIGIRNHDMSNEDQNLARLVRERTRQSKRSSKFQLGGDDEAVMTHRGEVIRGQYFDPSHVVLDEKEVGTDLDEVETSLHFGGGGAAASAYGRSDLSTQYLSRKTELDEMIIRRKVQKAERQQSKEEQVGAFTDMDVKFKELSRLLSFRDKEKTEIDHMQAKKQGRLTEDDQEMADWDKEMKQFMLGGNKVAATNRTKTLEEIAKEEADRLHELETRRLARMQGDFENDDLSDVEEEDTGEHPEDLDSETEQEPEASSSPSLRFTGDGLVRVDSNGNVLGKAFDDKNQSLQSNLSSMQTPTTVTKKTPSKLHKVGTKIMACYRGSEQTDGNHSWFSGHIVKVNPTGTYEVEYDDGDFESGVLHEHTSVLAGGEDLQEAAEPSKKEREDEMKQKRLKATMKARNEMPFVFEVPTTLEMLNEMIGNHASTGHEASLLVDRIHKANSVRLNHKNSEKMQNFYDIILRRFIAIGDAIHEGGDGGIVGRYAQLDSLTSTLYDMSQENPEGAAATWSRRLGFMHAAHLKRLRDASFEQDDGFTAWPSTGTFLALRLVGHIFPVTDKRHSITTPTILFLGQILTHTPLLSQRDLMAGTLFCGLLLEYTKGAKRIAPEAHAFLAGLLRLFGGDRGGPLPTLNTAVESLGKKLRELEFVDGNLKLSLHKSNSEGLEAMSAVLISALALLENSIETLTGEVSSTEPEVFADLAESILLLQPRRLPKTMQEKVSAITSKLHMSPRRQPLCSQVAEKKQLKTLAPRIEATSVGRKNKTTEADRLRRELKREHKSTVRDIRMDASVVESERRRIETTQQEAARAKRQKAFAWMEQEQATINNQVREGGGLLHGGGMGAAKSKAKSAKLGMKKGGKL